MAFGGGIRVLWTLFLVRNYNVPLGVYLMKYSRLTLFVEFLQHFFTREVIINRCPYYHFATKDSIWGAFDLPESETYSKS